jgi:hypothetical protein
MEQVFIKKINHDDLKKKYLPRRINLHRSLEINEFSPHTSKCESRAIKVAMPIYSN